MAISGLDLVPATRYGPNPSVGPQRPYIAPPPVVRPLPVPPAPPRPAPVPLPTVAVLTTTPAATQTLPSFTNNITPETPLTTTDLPTPSPYTGTAEATSTVFMRPSKASKPSGSKEVKEKPSEFAFEAIAYITPFAERLNPCPEGMPLMNEFESPVTCNFAVQPNGGCPEDYWCHTGASFATTACCPIVNWSMLLSIVNLVYHT